MQSTNAGSSPHAHAKFLLKCVYFSVRGTVGSADQGSRGALGTAAFSNKELGLFGSLPNLGNGENGLRIAVLKWGWGPAPGGTYLKPLGDFKIQHYLGL